MRGLDLSMMNSGLSMWENLRDLLYTSELIRPSLLGEVCERSLVFV